jgi:hypothetical protein
MRLLYIFLSFILLLSHPHQTDYTGHRKRSHAPLAQNDSTVPQKDILDIIFPRKNIAAAAPVLKPWHPYYSILPGVGYIQQNGFILTASGIVSFYSDTIKDRNISSVRLSGMYTSKNQFMAPMISDIWTPGNKYNFVGDWRYYFYPSYTYGLGAHSSPLHADLLQYSYLRIHEVAFKRIGKDWFAGPGFSFDDHWNIVDTHSDSVASESFSRYNREPRTISSGLTANLMFDSRRNINNPLPGSYLNLSIRQNLTLLGSTSNWSSMTLDARKYIRFPGKSRNILAFWNYDWLTLKGSPPYLDMPSNGWDTYENTARGYVQGRFRGRQMVYFESEYRMSLTKNGLLGAVLFANCTSVSRSMFRAFNVWHPAAGAGFRLKINKSSNMNLGVDYGIGEDGSHGLYINVGEVF